MRLVVNERISAAVERPTLSVRFKFVASRTEDLGMYELRRMVELNATTQKGKDKVPRNKPNWCESVEAFNG